MNVWTIVLGILGLFTTTYAAFDLFQKRRSMGTADVVNSAVQLLKTYENEATSLRVQLVEANSTISQLKAELSIATGRVEELNKSLQEAQVELTWMRIQVNNMKGP